jgi:hypothetical protein
VPLGVCLKVKGTLRPASEHRDWRINSTLVCRYLMVHATQPHFGICGQRWGSSTAKLVSEATVLQLPAITDAGGKEVALGQVAGVASDPFDGSLWLFVR